MPDPQPATSLTYESVLLPSNRNSIPFQDSHINVTSYAQIDLMLERMLHEVEKQEELFGLDLNLIEDNDVCVNSFSLEPSEDALIEIPIKKRQKIYQTATEIPLTENYYEPINSVNSSSVDAAESEYDLMSFENNFESGVTKIAEKTVDDDCMPLLENAQNEKESYKYPMYFKRAESESFSDLSDDNWDSNNDTHQDDDYEPIFSDSSNSKPHQFYGNDDVWWEGAYRNLSIVPEEDEENLSLLGSYYSNKTSSPYATLEDSYKSLEFFNQHLYANTTCPKDGSVDNYATDTSKSKSTDESDNDACEKVVKAEVKILVKTSERGKDEIEIRSVREFVDSSKIKTQSNVQKKKRLSRSQTLPTKLSSTFTGLTGKVTNMIGANKNSSKSYSSLRDDKDTSYNKDHNTERPVFTLQRLFVRTPEAENMKNFGSFSDLQKSKERSSSQTELIPLPPEQYPLQCSVETYGKIPHGVDLYANTPFYPCYTIEKSEPFNVSNPFTEFVPNPFQSQGYCDWLSPEELCRGNVVESCFRAKLIRMDFGFCSF